MHNEGILPRPQRGVTENATKRRIYETRKVLLVPVGDPAARQVVRRHLDGDTIANEDADAILAHLAGDCGEHDVIAVIEAYFEKGVGLLIDDSALRRD